MWKKVKYPLWTHETHSVLSATTPDLFPRELPAAAAVRKMIVMRVERLPEKRGTGDRNYSRQSVTQQTCYTPAKDLLNPEAWRVLCLH